MPNFSRPGPMRPQREKNFFIVSGLPPDFNWQRLKDMVRKCTTNQPGWTNMDDSWHGPDGAKGYFSVRTDADAERVYHLLTVFEAARLNRPLLVHHFDASRQNPVLLVCNCSAVYPGINGHSANMSHITAQSVLGALSIPDWQPIAPAPMPFVTIPMQHPSITVPVSVPMPMYPQGTYYQPAPAMTAPVSPLVTNEYGLPINARNGVVATESRGVHMAQLPYGITEPELRDLLRPYGRPLAVHLAKGHATVQFGSRDEARRVIERLNNLVLKGRAIHVKGDRESTAVSRSDLVICNGGPQRRDRDADR